MKKSPALPRRSLLIPISIFVLIALVALAAAWTATNSPALGLTTPPTPTVRAQSFAFAQIAKPTYTVTTAAPTDLPTASPTLTLESAPTAESTATTEAMVIAEIVEEAAVIDYPAPVTQPIEISAPGYGGNKYILVDISEQHMYVYEGDMLVYSFVSSTGMNNATRVGSFSVLDKIPNAYGATWDIWMPNWLGIYWAGSLENGIHALPILSNGATLWSGYLGIPISYGCVVLGSYESQLLYDWADVGTPVDIQW